MNKEYMNVTEGIFINTDKKMEFREEHIDPSILKLENETEIMEEHLAEIEKELERKSEKNSNKDLGMWILFNVGLILACKFIPIFLLGTDVEYVADLGKTVNFSTSLMKVFLPLFNILSLFIDDFNPFHFFKNKKIRKELNAQKEFLVKSIAEAKSRLTEMKSTIKEVHIDKGIQSLDSHNKNYRQSLKTKLDFIKNYQKYKKRYLEAYQNGTLRECFQNSYANLEVDFVGNIMMPDINDDTARKRTKN